VVYRGAIPAGILPVGCFHPAVATFSGAESCTRKVEARGLMCIQSVSVTSYSRL